ncbi:hypothetical protein EUX98_g5691 [Antrodiella citrinella]|uniref:F-box domain-containing protein n=1 Tax=Antrodiella citrinella TaxID=2447956 RepID=A0A4S4MQU3_9APHY|nr:hypothetical protein EUX98_g5691 [Antrodiella citrinella]
MLSVNQQSIPGRNLFGRCAESVYYIVRRLYISSTLRPFSQHPHTRLEKMTIQITLPPELIDETLDHLWDDEQALQACGLACKAWSPTTRLHLFRTVRIRSAKDCSNLSTLVDSAPIIARCIRKLTISAEYHGVDSEDRGVEDDAWVNDTAGLLAKLDRVHTLALSRVQWDTLVPETKRAFSNVFRSVKTLLLFEVRFYASADVLEFLTGFPELSELYFHGVSWTHESHNPFPAQWQIKPVAEQMQLSYLFLDPRSSPTLVTEWLLNHPVEQKLRTIQLCWREMEDAKALGDLLQVSGSTLERLQVEFPAGLSQEALRRNQLSISNNTNLRSLHFGGLDVSAAASRTFVSEELFPWVAIMLGQVRSPVLQEVVFELDLPDVPDLQSFDWAHIDRELSKDGFRGLTVWFYVNCTDRDRGDILGDQVKRAIEERLPGFKKRAAAWAQDNSALFVSHGSRIDNFDTQGNFLSSIYEPLESLSALICKDKGSTVIFSTSNEVSVLEAHSGKVAHKFDTHKSPITSLALSSDATLLASITPDAVHIHNLSLNTSSTLRGLPLQGGSVTACAFHPHSRTRLLLGIGNLLAIYESTRGSGPAKVISVEKESAGRMVAITSSPFSKTLIAVAFSEGIVGLMDLEKERGLFRTLSLNVPLTSLLFSPEGAALYAGTETGKILALDLRSLDKPPKSITISGEGRQIVCMTVQRKLKPGESSAKPTTSMSKSVAPQEIKRTTTRRTASNTTTVTLTVPVPDKKATTTRAKLTTIISPPRTRTTSTTTPVRSRVTSAAATTRPTPSPRPPVRTRTISTILSPSTRVPSVPARPATVAGRASGTSPGIRRVSGPLSEKRDITPTKSPLNKSAISEKSARLDVSVSVDELLDLPKNRKENLSPSGVRQRAVSSLSAASSRTTRTRTISTTSQRSTASSRAMTGSTLGTSVSGASSISRTTTARTAKSSTSAKPSDNTRKNSKEWAADSMSPIPPVPPLPIAFGEAESLTGVKCPVSRDRTPSPDLPEADDVPVTPLPPTRAAKGKAPQRHMGVLGLGTPEVQRWFEAGDSDKRDSRKVGFVEEGGKTAEQRAKSPNSIDEDDEDDELQEAKIEMTVQISPRRPPATSSTSWAPVPSPLRNSLSGLGANPAAVPGSSSNPAQDLLSTLIRDALYDFRRETRAEIVGLHLDLVNMGRGWKKEMKDAMEQWGKELHDVREENVRLKEENERLRRRY